MPTALFRLRVLFCCLTLILILAIVPLALYAQAPTSAMGVRLVSPYQFSQLGDGVRTTRLSAGAFVVAYTDTGGPAAVAGIRPGDVITGFNGKRVCQGTDLVGAISNSSVGTEVTVVFVRGDEIRNVRVKITNRTDFDPAFRTEADALPKITADWGRKDYKAVISDCRAISEPTQALADTACALAAFNRRDPRKGNRLFELSQGVCPQCVELYADQASALNSQQADYSAVWSKAVQLMNDFSAAQKRAFAAMDSRVATDMKRLSEQGQTKAAVDRYVAFAQEEIGCRSEPPSPELTDAIIQIKSKLDPTLSVPDDAAHMAKQARTAAQIAKSQPEMVKAEERWIGVIWLAPWWSEGYTNAADLLDGIGLPDNALALGKRALQLPHGKTAVAQATPATIEEPIGDPSEAIRQCINGLATVEKGSSDEQRLRLRAINAALKMSPPPDASMEARRFVARGNAGIEMGQAKTDFADAAGEFEKAIQIAPWWADAYKGLGLANEKAANYRQSMAAYNLYVKAAPNAPDVAEVQNKIFKLEYAADRDQKQAFEKVIAAKEANARIQGLQGLWRERDKPGHVWQATVQNGMFVASRPGVTEDDAYHKGPHTIRASIKGATLDGTLSGPPTEIVGTGCETSASEQPLTGTISEDGRSMTVKYQQTVYSTQYMKPTLFTVARCLKIEKLRDDLTVVVLEKN
jgi:tetratricopeptide (TPR) repeat protein